MNLIKPYFQVDTITDLRDMLRRSARLYGDRTAFMQKVNGRYQSYSYKKVLSDTEALGTELHALGLLSSPVIVLGDNGYEWALSFLSVVCGGGTVVPVDKELPAEELANLIAISEAKAVLCSDKYLEKTEGIPAVTCLPFSRIPEQIRSGRERLHKGEKEYLAADNRAPFFL